MTELARTEYDEHTLIGKFQKLSVELNGLVIPPQLIERALARHSFNLFVSHEDETFKVSLVGSATAVRYRGRNLLLTTQHQLRGVDEQKVCMLTDSGSHAITSSGCRHYSTSSETDAYDIATFDFTEPCKDWPELEKRFFNLTAAPPRVPDEQILAILLTGYISTDQVYEIHENNHLGLARRQILCLPDSQPTDQALLAVRAERPLEDHPDGMSGGSAFVIQLQNDRPQAYFAGIIVRGGKNLLYILKASVVLEFLAHAFSDYAGTRS